jgi:predicted phosphate transport protein (TIGR00153 family)
MAINHTLTSLFGRSPITPMQEHMKVAVGAAELLGRFIEAAIDDDWVLAAEVQQEISEAENRADELKRELRRHLPKSLFLPVPRADLLELLSMQDKVANRAKDIAGLMLGRKMVPVKAIATLMVAFVQSAVDTAVHALKAINELDELLETGFSGRELDVVENLIEELEALESYSDKLEVEIRAALFEVEAELPPVDVMFQYRIIEWVGDLADRAEKVGSRLQVLLAR